MPLLISSLTATVQLKNGRTPNLSNRFPVCAVFLSLVPCGVSFQSLVCDNFVVSQLETNCFTVFLGFGLPIAKTLEYRKLMYNKFGPIWRDVLPGNEVLVYVIKPEDVEKYIKNF